jgi:hypothetical protein
MIATWRSPAVSGAGRAYAILGSLFTPDRGTFGLGDPQSAQSCLGCHDDSMRQRRSCGPRFPVDDGEAAKVATVRLSVIVEPERSAHASG